MGTRERPSLFAWSVFAVTWWLAVLVGWGLVLLAALMISWTDIEYMGLPLLMMAALVFFGELRPVITSESYLAAGVPISTAFVFATMYLWGLTPAILLEATAVLLSEMMLRKELWKLLFNVGQYVISVTAAWSVLWFAGVSTTPTSERAGFESHDLLWIGLSWVAYHLTNLVLVAGTAGSGGQSFWESFTEDFWYYTVSTFSVLAVSPFIALMTVNAWVLVPLLLLPLVAVYKTASTSLQNQRQALHDALTDLPNRMLLHQRVEAAISEARREETGMALFILDLDRFKEVNDTLGHPAGDALLEVVARRLLGAVRPGDTVARLGGDEFGVLLPSVQAPTDAIEVAGRIRTALAEPFRLDGVLMDVDVSIGIALFPENGDDVEVLMRRADVAMYVAKGEGTGIELYDVARDPNSPARLGTVTALREALDHGGLELHYQPKVQLTDGSVVGVEALVRWRHPERGLVPPDEFVPLAERTGLVHKLTAWVLRAALDQVADWWRNGIEVPVAVNVSMRDLQDTDLAGLVVAELDAHGLPPHALVLEVTESVLVQDPGRAVGMLRELAELGVSSSLDDFGTGYSSLLLLEKLPVAEIKIDRSFVRTLDEEGDYSMVRSIVGFAHGLGLSVVAEGVESAVSWKVLREMGCDVAQGYRVSRPLPAADATAWLHERVGRSQPQRRVLRVVGGSDVEG
ncbi:MAG TPA: EAL domain-containing protein [Candidatus Nanopelagicales bacterium]|nr:EAL domain-containing protein [Candidatus Nanopelagicales bacterium]